MTAADAKAPQGAAHPGSRRGLVGLLLCIIPFSQIPLDVYTPALPDMVTELHTTNALVQNTVTFYMLGMSLGLIPVGMIADAIGRKKTLLACMSVLVIASVGCALASNVTALIALRFVQGLGGCGCMVVTYAVAADLFRGAELTSISGLLGMAWGLAPVLAPAAGGFLVQYTSWRMVFGLLALFAGIVAVVTAVYLPETLPVKMRSPIQIGKALSVLGKAARDVRFLNYTLIFAAMASAQLVFGVVAPFLYQTNLGYSAGTYGLIALGLGAANLAGELACTTLATRTTARQLCFGAWTVFTIGAAVLTISGTVSGSGFVAITVGGALALFGCGTLCPTMYGMALGLFSHNLGLLGGLISAICYLAVSCAMAVAAYLPETSQAPMGGMFVALAGVAFALLLIALSSRQREPISVNPNPIQPQTNP